MTRWLPIAGFAFLALAGCGDGMTSRASPERLDALVADGIDPEDRARYEERFAAAFERGEVPAALRERFDAQDTEASAIPLQELLIAALETDPAIGRAAQEVNRVDAARMNALFGYAPQIGLSYEQREVDQNVIDSDNAVFQRGTAQYPVTNAGLELRQPLVDLSRFYAIRIAGVARSAAEVRYVGAVKRTAFEVFDLYLEAAQSTARIEELTRRQALLRRQEAARRQLETFGLGDGSFRTAQLEAANTGVELSQERARLQRTLGQLSFRTGRAVGAVPRVALPSAIPGTERRISAAEAVERARRNNPQILAALISVAEGDMRVRQAIAADFAPVLDAFARLEREDREASRFGGGSLTQDQTIGVRLTVPLFNADGEGYRNLIARIDFRDAALQYFSASRQITAEVAATHERLAELSAAIAEARRALSAAQEQTTSEQALVDAGVSPEFVVASRAVRVSAAQEQLRFLELEYARAWALLSFLMGENLADL